MSGKLVVCNWYENDEGLWDGDCGIAWCLDIGTPAENDMNYCPKCGKRLGSFPYFDQELEDEE